MKEIETEIVALAEKLRRKRRRAFFLAPALLAVAVLLVWRGVHRMTTFIDAWQPFGNDISPDEIRVTCFMDSLHLIRFVVPPMVSFVGLGLLAVYLFVRTDTERSILRIADSLQQSDGENSNENQQSR